MNYFPRQLTWREYIFKMFFSEFTCCAITDVYGDAKDEQGGYNANYKNNR